MLIALLWLAPAFAAETQPQEPAPAAKDLDKLTPPQDAVEPTGESWWKEMVRKAPSCTAFTDGCRVCTKTESGFACSNLPIACQPQDWTCSKP